MDLFRNLDSLHVKVAVHRAPLDMARFTRVLPTLPILLKLQQIIYFNCPPWLSGASTSAPWASQGSSLSVLTRPAHSLLPAPPGSPPPPSCLLLSTCPPLASALTPPASLLFLLSKSLPTCSHPYHPWPWPTLLFLLLNSPSDREASGCKCLSISTNNKQQKVNVPFISTWLMIGWKMLYSKEGIIPRQLERDDCERVTGVEERQFLRNLRGGTILLKYRNSCLFEASFYRVFKLL